MDIKDPFLIQLQRKYQYSDIKTHPVITTDVKDIKDQTAETLPPLPLSFAPEGQFPFYGCSLCNISYLELKELDQHILTHKKRITSWDLRVQAFKKKKKLKKMQKLKLNLKDFKEETLEKTDEERCLEKIYKCAACLKQFSLSYYLKLHVRSHTGEKPYQCAECGVAFITASKLGRHRKMHTESKFECRICHKLFSRFDTLTKHFDKKHLDEKLDGEPYDYNAILPYLKELEGDINNQVNKKWFNTEHSGELDKKPIKTEDEKPLIEDIKEEDIDLKSDPVISDCTEPFALNLHENDVLNDNNDTFVDDDEFKHENDDNKVETRSYDDHFDEDDDKLLKDIKKETIDDISEAENYFPIDSWTTPHFELPKEEPILEPVKIKIRRKNKMHIAVKKEFCDTFDDPLKCKICHKHIKTLTYLRIHMRTHTGEKPFSCYICNKGFITSSKMNRHVLTHMEDNENNTEDNNIEGVDVKRESNCNEEENLSLKSTKTRRKRKKRNALPKNYIDSILTNLPIQKIPKKRPYSCDYCKKKFLHKDTLTVHMQTHKNDPKLIICDFCLTQFDTNEDLNSHTTIHTQPYPYLCTVCGKKYKKKETMIYHRRMHKIEKKYQCDVCSKTFVAPCKLQRHLLSHRPDKFVVRYECPVCAHIFNTKYHIEMHLTTHEKDGLIRPENRGEVLAMVQQNARKIPIQSDITYTSIKDLIPADERSRICNICGEIFHHFYYLEEHLKTHGTKFNMETDIKKSKLEEAERRYKCEVCQKGFKLHYYLKLHSFTHTKEKPFICQQCGKGFITKGKLKRHMESHAGLKKYQCHICCKFFTRPSYLRIHVKTIHGVPKDMYHGTYL